MVVKVMGVVILAQLDRLVVRHTVILLFVTDFDSCLQYIPVALLGFQIMLTLQFSHCETNKVLSYYILYFILYYHTFFVKTFNAEKKPRNIFHF